MTKGAGKLVGERSPTRRRSGRSCSSTLYSATCVSDPPRICGGTCTKLCREAGGDLEQIKFVLGHSSIQTTERYLGSEQEIAVAVNDNLGL